MKKKLIRVSNALLLTEFKHIFKIMKITSLLGFVCVASAFAAPMDAQTMRVDISANQTPAKEVIKQIEEQTDYLFVYNKKVNLNNKVTLDASDITVAEALNSIFSGTDIVYAMEGNNILLMNKKEDSVQQNGKTKQITGTVVDASGIPVIGANVMVKGTTNGTITDMNGKFVLEVPEGSVLDISYIGYINQIINVGKNNSFNIALKEDTQKLDEVVVVGYGTFKKSDLTGAITQVKGDEISNLPLRSAADALQGKAAGVTITANSGSPGSLGDVRIRGIGTLNGNNPLYVVDGMPQSDIGWLNPRDIENLEVLKDASAQAIYGARAANGVILITTKRGTKGSTYRSNIEFDMTVGFQSASKKYDMLDAEGFMEYKNRAYAAAGMPLLEDFSTAEKREQILSFLEKNGGREGTDWWDEITRNPSEAINQNYNFISVH